MMRQAVDLGATRLQNYRDDFLAALDEHASDAAMQVVESAVSAGADVLDVYLSIFEPALVEVGHKWALGQITVADEHYATAVCERALDRLSRHLERPPPDGRLAIVSATPGELHTVGLRMVSDFLMADGWEVLHLGASTPKDDLLAMCDSERPDLIALSTSTPASLPHLSDVIAGLRELQGTPLIVVGGQLWTSETRATGLDMGADVVSRDPRELVGLLRERIPPPSDS